MAQYNTRYMNGRRFGRLTVIRRNATDYESPSGLRRPLYVCRCDCGTEILARGDLLRSRNVQSCGCLRCEKSRANIQKVIAALRESRKAQNKVEET